MNRRCEQHLGIPGHPFTPQYAPNQWKERGVLCSLISSSFSLHYEIRLTAVHKEGSLLVISETAAQRNPQEMILVAQHHVLRYMEPAATCNQKETGQYG